MEKISSSTPSAQSNTPKTAVPDDSATSKNITSAFSPSSSDSSNNFTLPVLDSSSFTTGQGGGALRSIDQKFAVNPSNGTLSLSIPLPLSKARGSFQPGLSLSHNSGSGNGPFGVGWGLGRPSVARKTSSNIPSYDDDDVFVFQGEDLVSLGKPKRLADGYSIEEYAPRVRMEDEVRIEKWSSTSDTSQVFWRTITSSNVTSFYGRDTLSQELQSVEGVKSVFSWLLCDSYDAFGNAYAYSYKAENDDGFDKLPSDQRALELGKQADVRTRARYLKRVMYGNRKPSRDMEAWKISPVTSSTAWCFSVVFDYGEHDVDAPTTSEVNVWDVRRDRYSSARCGFEIRNYRLCRRVLMFHHFPEKLGLDDYLVSSMSLAYDARPTGALLDSITSSGHVFDSATKKYVSESMEPLRLTYSTLPSVEKLKLDSMKPTCLQTLGSSRPGAVTRWVDLDSEGSPALLVQMDGVWYLQRNENAINAGLDNASSESGGEDSSSEEESELEIVDQFGPLKTLQSIPNVKDYSETSFEDLDGSGLQDFVITDGNGRVLGFYERIPRTDSWTTFQNIESVLNLKLDDPDSNRVDLTGNGRSDMLIPGDNPGELAWHSSLGKGGFSMRRGCEIAQKTGAREIRLVGDDYTTVYMADMTGDGLQDVVHVSAGRVSYFPNHGYGRFGSEVVMCNSPPLHDDGTFIPEMVQLLDIDGSGTTDLIYLPPSGGIMFYLNECGNGFSNGTYIPQFPLISKLSSIFSLDILGKGTSCLCWAGPESAGTDEMVIRYLDLAPQSKPYLLTGYSDGNGQETSIKYRPSTTFFLRDEREGRKWATTLPFPVHVVRRVVKRDTIEGNTQTTTYGYHDGYYDPLEREFRGFGAVETWESERIPVTAEAKFKAPVKHTKLWFHTGAPEVSLAPSNSFGIPKVTSQIPDLINEAPRREAFRSLKGLELRSEVYGHDGTSKSGVPYIVKESTYKIEMLWEPEMRGKSGISRVLPQEIVSLVYEREQNDPKIQHDMVLARNAYGSVTKALTANYGYTKSNVAIKEPDNGQQGGTRQEIQQREARSQVKNAQETMARELQEAHFAVLFETSFTDAIVENDSFYKPAAYASKTTHYSKFQSSGLLGLAPAQTNLAALVSGGDVIRGKETLTYFRKADLSGPLPLGKREEVPVAYQTYELFMTEDQCKSIQLGPNDASLQSILESGGYILIGQDWWRPSPILQYASGDKDELSQARASFFTPVGQNDPFGNISTVQMDEFYLILSEATDALGNKTTAVNSYRTMDPLLLTDANGNRSFVVPGVLGEKVAVARMGKKGEAVGDDPGIKDGDNLENVYLQSEEDAISFIKSPTEDVAKRILGNWSVRSLTCRRRVDMEGSKLPRFRITITRSEYSRSNRAANISVDVEFQGTSGNIIQSATVTSWDEAEWAISGHAITNSAGNPFKSFQPFFSNSPLYISHEKVNSPFALAFYDAIGSRVAGLNADKTWSKTSRTSWSTMFWDEGATLGITDPATDEDIGFYFSGIDKSLISSLWIDKSRASPDVHVKDAADRAAATYSDTYTSSHKNALGLDVARVQRVDAQRNLSLVLDRDARGNVEREGDPLGRIIQQSQYDILGKPFQVSNMDTGVNIMLKDCMNSPLFVAKVGGASQRFMYDALRRNTEVRVRQKPSDTTEILWARTRYGEGTQDAVKKNMLGQVFRVEDQSGVREVEAYDFQANVLSETRQLAVEYKTSLDWSKEDSIKLEEKLRISAEYDALKRPVLSTDMLGRTASNTFDLLGNIAAVKSKSPTEKDWTVHISKRQFTADGLLNTVVYSDSLVTTYEYEDASRRLIRKTTQTPKGDKLEEIEHTYDCYGRLCRKYDSAQDRFFFRNQKVEPVEEYWYDALGMLVKATGREQLRADGAGVRSSPGNGSDGNTDARQMVSYTETYTYDDAYNILVLDHQVSDAATQKWTRKYSYEAKSLLQPDRNGNRLTSTETAQGIETYNYSATGATVSMPGFSQIGWDCLDKMKSISTQRTAESTTPETTWFTYDSAGARVRKVTERSSTSGKGTKLKDTVFLGAAEKYTLYSGDGASQRKVTKTSHIRTTPNSSPEATIEQLEDNASLIRYQLSPNLEVDSQGRTISYEEYSPFGASTFSMYGKGITAPSEFRFASYRRDKETGLFYCGARYYCPWLGRWMSADPIGTEDGPNVYCYCRNDPVNFNDTRGTCRFWNRNSDGLPTSQSSEDLKPMEVKNYKYLYFNPSTYKNAAVGVVAIGATTLAWYTGTASTVAIANAQAGNPGNETDVTPGPWQQASDSAKVTAASGAYETASLLAVEALAVGAWALMGYISNRKTERYPKWMEPVFKQWLEVRGKLEQRYDLTIANGDISDAMETEANRRGVSKAVIEKEWNNYQKDMIDRQRAMEDERGDMVENRQEEDAESGQSVLELSEVEVSEAELSEVRLHVGEEEDHGVSSAVDERTGAESVNQRNFMVQTRMRNGSNS